jgi:amino acid permease
MIFFIVFGDVAGGLIQKLGFENAFLSSRLFTHSLLGISLIYLILLKDIKSLRYAGLIILTLIGVFMILFTVHYLMSNPDSEKEVKHSEMNFDLNMIASIPTFLTTYAFQATFFSAFSTLKNQTNKNGICADILGKLVAFIVYILSPVIAFQLYGENVSTNMLKNVAEESGVLPTILQILFLIIAVMHIPLIFYIGKENVLIMFDQLTRGSYSQKPVISLAKNTQEKAEAAVADIENQVANENNVIPRVAENSTNLANKNIEDQGSNQPKLEIKKSNSKAYLEMKPFYYYLITLICFFMVVVVSIVVGDVAIFFKIIGCTVGAFLIFIGPASFYIISVKKTKTPLKTIGEKCTYLGACLFIVVGMLESLIIITIFI